MKRGLTDLCYGFFSTLANPTRLAILEALDDADMSVTQLAEALGQEQSMVSHNLRSLERCRFVSFERQGKSKVYRLNQDTVGSLFKTVALHAQIHCPFGGTCAHSQ